MYLESFDTQSPTSPAYTPLQKAPQGKLRYLEDVGIHDKYGQLKGQVRLMTDEANHTWAFGTDRHAVPYDVTLKTREQIARGVANGDYNRLSLFPAPPHYREDIGVHNQSGKPTGQIRLKTDSAGRVWASGTDPRAKPYDVTGKSREEIARGVANGYYGRLSPFPAAATERSSPKSGAAIKAHDSHAGNQDRAVLTRYLDKVVNFNSPAKNLADLKARFQVIGPDGSVDTTIQKTWRLVENEAYASTSGKFGIEKGTNKIGANGTVVRMDDKAPAASANEPKSAPGFGVPIFYSLIGAIASYNNLVAAGLTSKQAWAQLPAGVARDAIGAALLTNDHLTVGPVTVPLDSKNPYLKVLIKGGVAAIMTAGTNFIAGKIYGPAKPEPHIGAAMLLAGVLVNGAVVALDEARKRGYVGGPPPTDPKNMTEWLQKNVPEGLAVGLGVAAAFTPAVAYRQIRNMVKPPPAAPGTWSELGEVAKFLEHPPSLDKKGLAKVFASAVFYPLAQYLIANGVVNPPKDIRDLMKNSGGEKDAESNAKSFLLNLGNIATLGMIEPALRTMDPVEFLSRLGHDLHDGIAKSGTSQRPDNTAMMNEAETAAAAQSLDQARVGFSGFLRAPPSKNDFVRGAQATANLMNALVHLVSMPTDQLRSEFEKEMSPSHAEQMTEAIQRFKANLHPH